MKDRYAKIIKEMEFFRYKKDITEVFKDLMCVMALRTTMMFEPQKKREQRCKTINQVLRGYDKDGKEKFGLLQSLIVEMLKDAVYENNFGDHLGELYMSIIPKQRASSFGQFFTPYHLSYTMAEMNMGDCEEIIKEKGIIKINDPCVGAGGMLVAVTEVLHKRKINYLQFAEFWGNDVDLLCCYMSYLQMAFLGTAAVIEHKCTLKQECWDKFVTPGFYLRNVRIPSEEDLKLLDTLRAIKSVL